MRTDHQQRYRNVLNEFMSFRDSTVYAKDCVYADSVLGGITPAQLKRFFELKAFGVADPPPKTTPTECRSSSLQFYKKAISYYMPNRLVAWNSLRNTGNPTRSLDVNDLIKKVKRFEARGAESKAARNIIADTGEGGGMNRLFQQMQALYGQMNGLRTENREVKLEIRRFEQLLGMQLRKMDSCISKMTLPPAVIENNDANNNEDSPPATLVPSPKNISVLWQEFMFGIAGRKPARTFSARERGKCKCTYNRRKLAWAKIAELIRSGHTAQSAIDLIYDVYGKSTGLSAILVKMRYDRRNGWPKDLVVNAAVL